jgi:hypothetical protein
MLFERTAAPVPGVQQEGLQVGLLQETARVAGGIRGPGGENRRLNLREVLRNVEFQGFCQLPHGPTIEDRFAHPLWLSPGLCEQRAELLDLEAARGQLQGMSVLIYGGDVRERIRQ